MNPTTTKTVADFRREAKEESTKLDKLCSKWKKTQNEIEESHQNISDDLFTIIGMAELLIGQKGRFTQFLTLIDACEHQTGEQKTTLEDLEGFWGMLLIQFDQCYDKFEKMEKLKANNWVEEKPKIVRRKKKVVKKPAAVKKQ